MDSNGNDRPAEQIPAPLAEHLASTAASLDVGQPSVEAVVARGRQRQHRTRVAIGTVGVLAVAGLSITAVTVLSRPTEHRVVGAPADSVAPDPTASSIEVSDPSTPAAPETADTAVTADPADTAVTADGSLIVASDFVWNEVDPNSAEAVATADYGDGRRVVGDGPFVALSTAPGTRDEYAPVIWRSDDGASWHPVETPPELVARSIASGGGRFFTLGTTPAAADTGRLSDVAVSSSADGGLTWDTTVLPLDTSALDGQPGVKSVGVITTGLAAGPEGVMVAAQAWPNLDIDSMVPADGKVNGFNPTPDGLQVYGAATCDEAPATTVAAVTATTTSGVEGEDPCTSGPPIDRTIPWADLGIAPAVVDAMFSPGLHLFASTDGATFDEVPVPSVDGETVSGIRLAHLDSGFAMMVSTSDGGPSNGMVFDSADLGRTWTRTGVAPVVWPFTFDGSGDQLVITGNLPEGDGSEAAVAVRTGSTWATTRLNDLLLPSDGVLATIYAFNAVVGPSGVTMSGGVTVDPVAEIGGVELAHDGVVLRAEDTTGSFQVLDEATRAELGTVTYWSASSGAVRVSQVDGAISVVADDGSVRATFTQDDLSTLMYGPNVPIVAPITLVLHSADGVRWSRESLSDIAGEPIASTGGIRINGSQVVVAANTEARNPDGTPHQVLLIGTPAG